MKALCPKGAAKTLKNSGKRLLHVRVWGIAFLTALLRQGLQPIRVLSGRGGEATALDESLVGRGVDAEGQQASWRRKGRSVWKEPASGGNRWELNLRPSFQNIYVYFEFILPTLACFHTKSHGFSISFLLHRARLSRRHLQPQTDFTCSPYSCGNLSEHMAFH